MRRAGGRTTAWVTLANPRLHEGRRGNDEAPSTTASQNQRSCRASIVPSWRISSRAAVDLFQQEKALRAHRNDIVHVVGPARRPTAGPCSRADRPARRNSPQSPPLLRPSAGRGALLGGVVAPGGQVAQQGALPAFALWHKAPLDPYNAIGKIVDELYDGHIGSGSTAPARH